MRRALWPFMFTRFNPANKPQLRGMLSLFAAAFHDSESYLQKQPRSEYLPKLLGRGYFIRLVAVVDGVMAGALVAYELKEFEQERSELYIYDFAAGRGADGGDGSDDERAEEGRRAWEPERVPRAPGHEPVALSGSLSRVALRPRAHTGGAPSPLASD